ncbi:hypothetical protein P171DRAFT_191741 [Karstenula rhodostoma CBS 690.94]|uniref:Uncharacterized protein n=1 Tax=Karstenula rhodostoma CBS 690.94 TaxID=1392251 RepID=A0A9P4UGP1_9PLEO|nr:hypothetical protein P171DRAFT_191741 [Karstenula rhodostoma CBS 690.94]
MGRGVADFEQLGTEGPLFVMTVAAAPFPQQEHAISADSILLANRPTVWADLWNSLEYYSAGVWLCSDASERAVYTMCEYARHTARAVRHSHLHTVRIGWGCTVGQHRMYSTNLNQRSSHGANSASRAKRHNIPNIPNTRRRRRRETDSYYRAVGLPTYPCGGAF